MFPRWRRISPLASDEELHQSRRSSLIDGHAGPWRRSTNPRLHGRGNAPPIEVPPPTIASKVLDTTRHRQWLVGRLTEGAPALAFLLSIK